VDTALGRDSAGTVGVYTSYNGSTLGKIAATATVYAGVTFANLPVSPVQGTVAHVTDAPAGLGGWGSKVTDGGRFNSLFGLVEWIKLDCHGKMRLGDDEQRTLYAEITKPIRANSKSGRPIEPQPRQPVRVIADHEPNGA
jgi:hypothetical protein